MLDIFKAFILGIVEGITEFLPISSTGHLIVTENILNFKDVNELFTVIIQLGAIFAVIWYYRKDLISKTIGLIHHEKEALNFWLILIIGTIPAGLIGLLLDKSMGKLAQPYFIAVALILGGVVLWYADRKPIGTRAPRVDLATISKKQALLVGLGQAIAIIPGVSRSGASIVSGLVIGLNRPTATALSFYLSIPVMILASGYKIVKYGNEIPMISGGWPAIIIGLIISFITALFAIKWLLRFIAHHNSKGFAIYRVIAGFIILFLILFGVLQ